MPKIRQNVRIYCTYKYSLPKSAKKTRWVALMLLLAQTVHSSHSVKVFIRLLGRLFRVQ